MKRCQSMENLPMLPEEAKMAVSFLRLTLSDRQETAPESEFQSYMNQHSHFPYHKAVPFTMAQQIKQPPVSVNGSVIGNVAAPRVKRALQRRCESCPSAISPENEETTTESTTGYSQSAPAEGRGFFHRLFSSFLRKRPSATTPAAPEINNNEQDETVPFPHLVSQPIPIMGKTPNSTDSGHFVRVFTRTSGNNDLGNLIFMSMR